METQANEWWLEVAHSDNEKNNISVILGLGIYPKEVFELKNAEGFKKENIIFAYLHCTGEERKERLKNRGDEQLLQRNESWHERYYNELKDLNAKEISTSCKSIEDTATDIKVWLSKISEL